MSPQRLSRINFFSTNLKCRPIFLAIYSKTIISTTFLSLQTKESFNTFLAGLSYSSTLKFLSSLYINMGTCKHTFCTMRIDDFIQSSALHFHIIIVQCNNNDVREFGCKKNKLWNKVFILLKMRISSRKVTGYITWPIITLACYGIGLKRRVNQASCCSRWH